MKPQTQARSALASSSPGEPDPQCPGVSHKVTLGWLVLGAAVSLACCLAWSASLPAGSSALAAAAQILGVAIALACTLGPLMLALTQGGNHPYWSALKVAAGASAGCLAGGLTVCLPALLASAHSLTTTATISAIVAAVGYGVALVIACTGLQRLLDKLGLQPLTALGWTWLAVGLLYAAPTLLSPVLEALPSAATKTSVSILIRLHPRTVVEGSCFGLDPVRGRTLYSGFRVSTSHPYEYGRAMPTVLIWLLLSSLIHLGASTLNRRPSNPSQVPEIAPPTEPER